MTRSLPALLGAALLAAAISGCGRSARSPAMTTFTSERLGFTITRPATWAQTTSDEGARLWFLPKALPPGETPEGDATRFILVATREEAGPLPEFDVRRLAMTLLPMHGVSEFQRMPEGTDQIVWYQFELTGSTRGREWASVGLFVTGPRRYYYVVCAAPLDEWKTAQKVCDQVVRSFQPGDLTK